MEWEVYLPYLPSGCVNGAGSDTAEIHTAGGDPVVRSPPRSQCAGLSHWEFEGMNYGSGRNIDMPAFPIYRCLILTEMGGYRRLPVGEGC